MKDFAVFIVSLVALANSPDVFGFFQQSNFYLAMPYATRFYSSPLSSSVVIFTEGHSEPMGNLLVMWSMVLLLPVRLLSLELEWNHQYIERNVQTDFYSHRPTCESLDYIH